MPSDDERKMMELNNEMVDMQEAEEKALQKRGFLLSIGKWIADNIVAIGALVVAIIALVRTI